MSILGQSQEFTTSRQVRFITFIFQVNQQTKSNKLKCLN